MWVKSKKISQNLFMVECGILIDSVFQLSKEFLNCSKQVFSVLKAIQQCSKASFCTLAFLNGGGCTRI